MENIIHSTGSWKSSLLQRIGVIKAVIADHDRSNLKKYGAALMVAATIAIGSMAPNTAHAGPVNQAATEFVSSQSATSNINNSFGRTPSWSIQSSTNQAQRLADFDTMIQSSRSLSFEGKVNAVNNFFNKRIAYMEDIYAWGQQDYWATPLETLNKGAGDCEDFAIAKYFALEQLGVPQNSMKITYVKSTQFSEPHMVLLASKYEGGSPVVLDNMTLKAVPYLKRADLTPVYSFNEHSLFLGASNESSGGITNMSKWTEVLQRVSAESSMLSKAGGTNPYDMSAAGAGQRSGPIEARADSPGKTTHRSSSTFASGPGLG